MLLFKIYAEVATALAYLARDLFNTKKACFQQVLATLDPQI
jgi:hypothetical protein